jgi:hypothetical protein
MILKTAAFTGGLRAWSKGGQHPSSAQRVTQSAARANQATVRFVYSTRILSLQRLRVQHAAAPLAKSGSADVGTFPSFREGATLKVRHVATTTLSKSTCSPASPPKRRPDENGTLPLSRSENAKSSLRGPRLCATCATALLRLELGVAQA